LGRTTKPINEVFYLKKEDLLKRIIQYSIISGIFLYVLHAISAMRQKKDKSQWMEKKRKAYMDRKIARRYIKVPRRDMYEGY